MEVKYLYLDLLRLRSVAQACNAINQLLLVGCGLVLFVMRSSAESRDSSVGPLGFGQAAMVEPIATDRPDFTESALTIPAGHLQVESGYTFSYNNDGGTRAESHQLPEALLRIGLLEHTEARISWPGLQFQHEELTQHGRTGNPDTSTSGSNDLGLGAKTRLLTQETSALDLSLLFELGVPSGSRNSTSDGVETTGKILLQRDLGSDFSLSSNLNFAALREDKNYFFEPQYSISGGYQWTDALGSYLEYFGFFPTHAPESTSESYLNGGVTYLVTPNLQLDIRTGVGLNGQADDIFSGAGLSFRY